MPYNSYMPYGSYYRNPYLDTNQQFNNYQVPPVTSQPVAPQPASNDIIWVQGESGAKAYLVAPNTTVTLWDSESPTIYLKSSDGRGVPSMRILDFTERSFAAQTATTQGMNAIQSQLAQCCCDNRLATNDLKYTIATENCADRAALSDGIRDVITSQTANTQAILDKLCALELDGYKRENDQLRTQLNMANLSASQTAQNAFISQGFANEVDALYNRLSNCPVPSVPVYGRQPIFTCPNNNYGCGCGCGA